MSLIQKPYIGIGLNENHPLARGLVGCWAMNEATGDKVFDLSGNGNHGTNNGADWTADGLDFVASNNDHILNSGGNLKFEGANDSFTVSIWIKPTTLTTYHSLFWIQDVNDDMWRVLIWNDNTIKCSLDTIDFGSTSTISTGNRQHIVVVFNKDGNGQVYIGGLANGAAVPLNNEVMSLATNDLYIGNVVGDLYPFDGIMSNIQIYKRALSAEEVAYLHREPYAMFQPEFPIWQLYEEAIEANPYWYYNMLKRRNA